MQSRGQGSFVLVAAPSLQAFYDMVLGQCILLPLGRELRSASSVAGRFLNIRLHLGWAKFTAFQIPTLLRDASEMVRGSGPFSGGPDWIDLASFILGRLSSVLAEGSRGDELADTATTPGSRVYDC